MLLSTIERKMQQLQREQAEAKAPLKLVEPPPAEPAAAPKPVAKVVAPPTADEPTRTCGVSLPLSVHQELRARVKRGEARSIKEAALQAIIRGLAVRG
jgi:hypothetical protein